MIINTKEYFSLLKDRDYVSFISLLAFLMSLSGIWYEIFSIRDAGLFLMTFILSRLLFLYRTELAFDTMLEQLLDRMDAERRKPGFENGNLSLILKTEFPKIANRIKMKCLKELENDLEVVLSPAGDYTFYTLKGSNHPWKRPERM